MAGFSMPRIFSAERHSGEWQASRGTDRSTRPILTFLRDRLAPLDDPRSISEALRGKDLGDLRKYCVGDWRIIADLDYGVMLISVIRLGNRREIYRR